MRKTQNRTSLAGRKRAKELTMDTGICAVQPAIRIDSEHAYGIVRPRCLTTNQIPKVEREKVIGPHT